MLQTCELQQGDQLILRSFGQTPPAYRKRLITLGLTHNTQVKVICLAPLGCPLYLQIQDGAAIALRKNEAQHISWERLC